MINRETANVKTKNVVVAKLILTTRNAQCVPKNLKFKN